MTRTALRRFLGLSAIALAAVAAALLANCGTTTRLSSFEEVLDTDSKLKFEFHRIPDDPEGLGLRFPGVVLGFEKGPRGIIGCPGLVGDRLDAHIDLSKATGSKPAVVREKLKDLFDDRKCIFLSHVIEYTSDSKRHAIVHEFRHNLYAKLHQAQAAAPANSKQASVTDRLEKAYGESWSQLASVEALLAKRLHDDHATHVVLYTMGWNSGQTEALRNVNSLHLRLLEVLPDDVRPFPILVTWPSHWWDNSLGVFSYANKADDADELGAVFLNALIHRTIPKAVQAAGGGVRTIAVGHSFGARAIGRALCSETILSSPPTGSRWDLFVGLQGAFSINRFLSWDDADEGTPCSNFGQAIGKVVLTWSIHDSANTVASWSRHAGGERGYKTAREYLTSPEGKQQPLLDLVVADGQGHIQVGTASRDKIEYVDASQIVRFENYVKSGGAHSDIYNEQIARLLAQVIAEYAPAVQAAQP